MTTIAGQLSVEALRERYVSSVGARAARHFQTVWLLAKGHRVGEVAAMSSFGRRGIEQLVARYNARPRVSRRSAAAQRRCRDGAETGGSRETWSSLERSAG